MGCCTSSNKKNTESGNNEDGVGVKQKHGEVKTKEDFLRELDFVQENKVRITKEYNVLSPPLGRGAFGEVRKNNHFINSNVKTS